MINQHKEIENSKQFQESWSASQREAFSRQQDAVNEFSNQHNITREKTASIFAGISAGLSFGDWKKANLGVNGGVDGKISSLDAKLYNEAKSYAEKTNLTQDMAIVKDAIQSSHLDLRDSRGESISDTFNKADTLSQEAGIQHEKSKRFYAEAQYSKNHAVEVNQNLSSEYLQWALKKYGSMDAVLQMTNPNNPDKSMRDQSISEFMGERREAIMKSVNSPNFESEYKSSAADFSKKYQPVGMMQNTHFFGSGEGNSINNSHLSSSVRSTYSSSENVIRNTHLDDSAKSVIQQEQGKGVLYGLGEKGISEAAGTVKDLYRGTLGKN